MLAGLTLGDSVVTFNEVMYNPAASDTAGEWVELHNQLSVDVDLSDWRLADGIDFTFQSGTTIEAGEYLVIAKDPVAFASATGISDVLGGFTGSLSNGGETIHLLDHNDRVMDELIYDDSGDWPVAADGSGAALAKRSEHAGTGDPNSWTFSSVIGGTPGSANQFADSPLLLSEVAGATDANFRVELVNTSGSSIDLSGYSLVTDGSSETSFALSGSIAAGGYVTFAQATSGIDPLDEDRLFLIGPGDTVRDGTRVENSARARDLELSEQIEQSEVTLPTTADLTYFEVSGSPTLNVDLNRIGDANTAVREFRGLFAFDLNASGFSLGELQAATFELEYDLGAEDNNPALDDLAIDYIGTFQSGGAESDFGVNGVGKATAFAVLVANAPVVTSLGTFQPNFATQSVDVSAINTDSFDDRYAIFRFTDPSVAPHQWDIPENSATLTIETSSLVGGVQSVGRWQRPDTATFGSANSFDFEDAIVINEILYNQLSIDPVESVTATQQLIDFDSNWRYNDSADQLPGWATSAHVDGVDGWQSGDGVLGVDDAELRSLLIDASDLVAGTNRLSVEVHQILDGSSDIVLGAALEATIVIVPETPFADDPEEWIELYNKSGSDVDLSDWELSDGIEFTFAPGTILGAGDYLVVARDQAAIAAKYPGIDIAGQYDGGLSNSGERIELLDSIGNLADEVRYYDGGAFDDRADGGGSSLELRDPDADNSNGQAWSVSDSGDDSQWQTVTYTGVTTPHDGTAQIWNEFVFGLLDDGEILIDDISVIFDPGGANVELIQNGDFGDGLDTWRAGGNHRYASIVPDPDDASNDVLQLITTGSAEHILNHVETTFQGNTEILIGETYQISYRAKWVSGSNQLNTRLYFNNLPHTERLQRPKTTGTPGAVNFSAESNIGPTYQDLQQSVVAPSTGQSVSISVQAEDPDGVASVVLWYSADEGTWQQTATSLIGGRYTGTIPGFANGTVVQFYLEGTDGNGASSTFPAAGQDSRALYKVNASADGVSAASNSLQIVMLPSDIDLLLNETKLFSNDQIGATVIDETGKIYYDVGSRLKGSLVSRPGGGGGFWIGFNADDQYRGIHESVTINRNGLKEIYGKHLLQAAGDVPGFYDDIVNLEIPGGGTVIGVLNLARYGDVYLDGQYDDGADGNVFNFELLYKPTSTIGGVEDVKVTRQPLTTADGQPEFTSYGDDPEAYRYNFQLENNRKEDDFSGLIDFVSTFDLDGDELYDKAIEVLDLDKFVRTFTATSIVGQNDTYTRQANPSNASSHNEHNLRLFENPEDGKFLALPWDLDRTFQLGVDDTLWGDRGTLSKLFFVPQVSRLFYGHAEDIINNVYTTDYVNQWGVHYGDLVNDNGDFNTERNYILTRSTNLLTGLPDLEPYAITTFGGDDFSVDSNRVTLEGTGSYQIRELRVDGLVDPVNVTWLDDVTWQVTLNLDPGVNDLTIRAHDFSGDEIHSESIMVTSTSTAPSARDLVRVTEIHYNPTDPVTLAEFAATTDNDKFEFIEIHNPHPTETIALDGIQFIRVGVDQDGVDFSFGDVDLLPGEYAVILEDLEAFEARYGAEIDTGINVLGEWSGGLGNLGELITLVDSDGEEIAEIDYGDSDPWAFAADGNGASLDLIDPVGTTSDLWDKPYSWRASAQVGGTPGAASTAASGILINEILAHTDLPESDSIELFNPTDSSIDIGGWYLSDSGTEPLKYQIPAGTVLAVGAYVAFTEDDFNPTSTSYPGIPFALSAAQGDEVYLTEVVNADSTLLHDSISFGASFNGVTLGRTPDGSRVLPLANNSLGAINGGYAFEEVLITEINYNPLAPVDGSISSRQLEFIEVSNTSATQVVLTDWRIRGEVDFNFASGQILDSDASLLVVSFDPSDTVLAGAFRAHYGIGNEVTMVGPFQDEQALSNNYGLVKLQRPDGPTADVPPVTPHVNIDEFVYDDASDWPSQADGDGPSLQRIGPSTLGAFAGSWTAADPTPGSLAAANVQSVVINDGGPSRSEVTSITVTFDSDVSSVDESNFELTEVDSGDVISGLNVSVASNVVTLTFDSGDHIIPSLAEGIEATLADGNYALRYQINGFGDTTDRVDTFSATTV